MASPRLRSASPSPEKPDLSHKPRALPKEVLARVLVTMCETDAELEADPTLSEVDQADLPPPYAALLRCIRVPNKAFSRLARRQLYDHLHIRIHKTSDGPKADSEDLQISLLTHPHVGQQTRSVTIAVVDDFTWAEKEGRDVKRATLCALGGVLLSCPKVEMVHLVGFGPQLSTELVEVIASARPTLRRLALSHARGSGIRVDAFARALGRLHNLRAFEVHHALGGMPPLGATPARLTQLNLGVDAQHMLPLFSTSAPSLLMLDLNITRGWTPAHSAIDSFTNLVVLEVWLTDHQSLEHVVEHTRNLLNLRTLLLATHPDRDEHTFEQAKRLDGANLAELPPYLQFIELDSAALPFEVILGLLVSPGRHACSISWTEDPFRRPQREQMTKILGKSSPLRKRYLTAK